jgi:NADH-quinone oxidoreductase subunit L
MLFPLILLAIPSLLLGIFAVKPMLYDAPGLMGGSVTVLPQYNVLAQMSAAFPGVWNAVKESVFTLPFWFSVSGIFCAWFMVIVAPQCQTFFAKRFSWIRRIFIAQYGFDIFNDWFFVRGAKKMSEFFFHTGDLKILDSGMVDGSGRGVTRISNLLRQLQSGYLYHYVFVMIVGLLGFLIWLVY